MFGTIRSAMAAMALAAAALATESEAQEIQRGPLDQVKAIFGLAFDPAADGSLLLGSEYGLLRATPDGMAETVVAPNIAVAGLAADPEAPDRIFMTGFSEDGTPAGLFATDGNTQGWSQIADVPALISLSVSRLDATKLAGLDKTIRLSADAGHTWTTLESTPDQTFSVALSGTVPSRVFAATMGGVMVSDDNGKTWAKSNAEDAPATVVASLPEGRVAAFVYGVGVIMADEATLDWQVVADGFEDRYLRVLVAAPSSPGTIHAVADTGAILLSRDRGRNWTGFEGNDLAEPERIAAGKDLYADNCASCHGEGGIGEDPSNPSAKDEFGFKAPALNDDMHAWHHSDAGLRTTIQQGSPRNERMIAWQEVLSDAEIGSILAYVKSTWSVRSLACQGARHMACMGQ